MLAISKLTPDAHDEAARLLATTMSSNPINRAVFKSANQEAIRKQEQMFRFVLARPGFTTFAATIDGRIAGVMCYTTSDNCQLNPLAHLPPVLSLAAALRLTMIPVLRWQKAWGKRDPKGYHLHFGPLAVANEYQGQQIGSGLLEVFCKHADAMQHPAFLETDKSENLALYQRFGFKVVASDIVLGIKTWFMQREPQF
ncbi:GNAT family N-acetyltransferase [Dyadobacter aurulentus]|uniref:GNAT family N-acetyltransferase n=1 Tax=Dyadobacter sp. UC 10 TaxID=2605428 RepID=UPI0011F0C736|nr:GNAT family N-acetyltransferase [Dyadobacter sp. UC 10]KAA0992279.1 GNAT family N-acetyltransferase [Dyadobacter sp. UC 10]